MVRLGSGSPGGGFKTGCFVGGGMAGGIAVFVGGGAVVGCGTVVVVVGGGGGGVVSIGVAVVGGGLVGCCRCGLGRRRRRLLAGLLLSLTARAGWLVGWSASLSEYVISIFTWLRCWLILHSGCPSKSKPWMALTSVVGSCRLDELITRLFVRK